MRSWLVTAVLLASAACSGSASFDRSTARDALGERFDYTDDQYEQMLDIGEGMCEDDGDDLYETTMSMMIADESYAGSPSWYRFR